MQFEDFVEAHAADLVRLGAAMTGSQHDAEDFAQEALHLVARNWAKVDKANSKWSYARRLAINAHISRSRRRRVDEVPHDPVAIAPPTDMVTDYALATELDESLDAAISRLPQRQRAALVMRYYENLDVEEIAVDLGIAASSVRSSLARALATLRDALQSTTVEEQR